MPASATPLSGEMTARGEIDRRVINFVLEHTRSTGYSPTLREIHAGCGLRSLSAARASLARLQAEGVLISSHGRARGLQIVPDAGSGAVAADQLSLAGREVLEFFVTMERGYFPFLCRAATMAPDLVSAQEWLELVVVRVRQLAAIETALDRLRSEQGAVTRSPDVDLVWATLQRHCETIDSWEGWLAIEHYETDLILARKFPTCDLPASGMATVALEGNIDTARRGLEVVQRSVARCQSSDPTFVERMSVESERIHQVYASIQAPLTRIWPPLDHQKSMEHQPR